MKRDTIVQHTGDWGRLRVTSHRPVRLSFYEYIMVERLDNGLTAQVRCDMVKEVE